MKFKATIQTELLRDSRNIATNCNSIIFISLNENVAKPTLVDGFPLAFRQPYAINFQSDTVLTSEIKLSISSNSNDLLVDSVHIIRTFCTPI